jgi:hypothetical protein
MIADFRFEILDLIVQNQAVKKAAPPESAIYNLKS